MAGERAPLTGIQETPTGGAVSVNGVTTKVYTGAPFVEILIPPEILGASDIMDVPVGAGDASPQVVENNALVATPTSVPVVAGANHAGANAGRFDAKMTG